MTITNKHDAFVEVLAEVKNPMHLFNVPAYVGLTRLITLAGRLPMCLALESLTLREATIVKSVFGRDEIVLVRPDSRAMQRCNVLVTLSPFGKVSVYERAVETPVDTTQIVAGMQIGHWILDKIADKYASEFLLEEQERRQLDEMLRQWETAGLVDEKIDQLISNVSRIANVFIYIDRQIYSKSDIGSNTLLRDGLLQELKGHPVDMWRASDRLCVAAIYLLFLTGRPISPEEFNGKQLTAIQLRRWLTHKLCLYCSMLGERLPVNILLMPLPEIAAHIHRLSDRVNSSKWVSFRRINGITLAKEECFVAAEDTVRHPTALPPMLVNFAAQKLGIELDATLPSEQNVRLITLAALQKDRCAMSTAKIEQIIEILVLSAILEAGADYGMSSSIRNPSRLKDEESEARGSGVFSLAKEDFFCCVLPHPQIVGTMPTSTLNQILYSSSQRMQFNRWHFIPGNFAQADIPVNRHYYMPPQTSDMAEWSDLRHAGHIAAGVRYAIRAPGPPHWQEPLMAFGHSYRGFYDIRLVRMQGPPFEKSEMWVANRHMALIDAFWRAVLFFVEQEGYTAPIVRGYTRSWYMTQEWQRLLGEHLGIVCPAMLTDFAELIDKEKACAYANHSIRKSATRLA